MNRADVCELHYIVAIANVPSIVRHGILCHRDAQKLPHNSVAMAEIQDIRHAKPVPPGTKTVHDFANLYFHARNPMMYKRRHIHQEICVLQIRPDVLNVAAVMISDQNAASNYARFYGSPAGLDALDRERVYAMDWNHEEQHEYWRRKSAKCAEVLVPDRVASSFLAGAYVSGHVGHAALVAVGFRLPIQINPALFFQA